MLSKCASSHESWAAKKPKLTIHAISNADYVPIFEPDEAARGMCQHCDDVFRAHTSDIPSDRAETMLAFCSTGAS